jgi:hypothetical protein
LFFDAETWRGLRARYAAAGAQERARFDAVLQRVQTILQRPLPVYRTPEEMVQRQAGLTVADSAQELWQRPIGDDLVALSFALALEENPAVRARLHDTVLAACDFPHWGAAYPNQDLSAGHLARGIAIAYDWHPELWSEADRQRIRATIRTRMEAMTAATFGGIFWSGRYDENHLQVSVAGLGLCGVAFLGEIPEAASWTAAALSNFESVASESHADGSSDEGIPYWSYGMSFTLQFIEGTANVLGTRSLYDAPYFRYMIQNRLHASTPDLAGALPWGDAPARDYNGPHHLLYRLASQYHDGTGQYLANHLPFPPGGGADSAVWTALWHDASVPEIPPTDLDRHAEVGGLITTRSGWKPEDYLLTFKAGFTNRNHSHLDAGAMAFCYGHDWLLTTPGYGRGSGEPGYWKKDGERWTYQSNATEAESTLVINGHNQRFTADARGTIDSYVSSAGWFWTSADLTSAYDDITQVRRDVLHRRGDYFLVLDEIAAAAPVTAEWLAQVPPAAKLLPDQLTSGGRGGVLALRVLLPNGLGFAPRTPTSEHLDVTAERLKTYALTQTGTALHYAVALVPARSGQPQSLKNLGAKATSDGEKITFVGVDWEDRIEVNFKVSPSGRVTAVRRVKGEIESRLSVGATEFSVDALTLHFSRPADLAATRVSEGKWILDLGTALELTAALPAGWTLLSQPVSGTEAGSLINAGPLSPGRYLLQAHR